MYLANLDVTDLFGVADTAPAFLIIVPTLEKATSSIGESIVTDRVVFPESGS